MPNISGFRLQQLERMEAELRKLNEQKSMQPFVELFVHNLGTLAALRPFSHWTEQEKAAFHSAAQQIPTGAELYKAHLPKDPI